MATPKKKEDFLMFRTIKVLFGNGLILTLAAFVFFGNGTVWAQSTFKLRYFTGMTPSHYFCADLMPYFASEVEKRTNGRVKVELYPGGQLFGYQDGIDAATMGAVEMGLTSAGQWGGHNPVFKFSDYFLLIEDMDHWFRARDKVHPILDSLFQKKNVKLLYYSAYGANGICSLSPIENLQAIKGLKVRAPVPGAFDCLEAWGAVSAKVAAAEVYDALGKRAIDAAVSSWGVMYSRKFYEVAKHFIGPLWWTVWVNFIDIGTWNKMPEDIQQIILEVSKETEAKSLGIMKDYDQKSIDQLKEVGSLKLLTETEKKEWVKPLEAVFEAWVKECAKAGFGEEARGILEALNQAR
jgi:TRAP-type C4-dicarboxylate transport system substrate-binding protein